MPRITTKKYAKNNLHKNTLIAACKHGKINVITDLLTRFNTVIDFKDKHGLTPIDYAKMNGYHKIAEFLEKEKEIKKDEN